MSLSENSKIFFLKGFPAKFSPSKVKFLPHGKIFSLKSKFLPHSKIFSAQHTPHLCIPFSLSISQTTSCWMEWANLGFDSRHFWKHLWWFLREHRRMVATGGRGWRGTKSSASKHGSLLHFLQPVHGGRANGPILVLYSYKPSQNVLNQQRTYI